MITKLQIIEDQFSQINHGNKGKVIKIISDRAGKSRITVKIHWLSSSPSVPDKYQDMVIHELETFIQNQDKL